jgi:UDPglucose 6-dehydrogenase
MDDQTSIGVVGMGFVGGSIFRGFNLYCDVKGYDVDESRSTATLDEVAGCDYVFIALPTPMKTVTGGRASIALIDDAIGEVLASPSYAGGIIAIKSTIPPGTTDRMIKRHGTDRICHSPEFLTERAALADFLTPSRHIVGAKSVRTLIKMTDLFNYRFPGVPVMPMSPVSAELVKYGANCFFATKVMFFNELYMIADSVNADWDDVLQGVMADGRIGHSHNSVPGHDGDMGYGGKCFPKDLNALLTICDDKCMDMKLLKAVWAQNLEIRENYDWADIKGAVE